MAARSPALSVEFVPVGLPAEFPLRVSPEYIKTDTPIRLLHVHDCLEIGYCHEGSGIIMVGEKVLSFQAGDMTFINHTEVHFSASAAGTTSRWTWTKLDPVRLLPGAPLELSDTTSLAGPDFINVFSPARHQRLVETLMRLISEARRREPHWESAVRALILEILVQVRRVAPALPTKTAPAWRDYDRLAPALQSLAQRYTEPLRVGALAKRCGLSEAHFRRLFTATLGRPPQAYWLDLRLQMAASLLCTSSRSILEISTAAGFATLSSFNRLFRRRFQSSPTEWRQRGGATAKP